MKKSIHTKELGLLCAWLRQSRIDAGYTQQALATKLRKPQSFVAKYENGERRLDVIEFLAITRQLNADVQAVLKELG